MEIKKESIKLIIKQEMFGVDGDDRSLFHAQSEKVAERIVKLFAIPDVVGRSKQFTCKICGTHEKEWNIKNSDWYCKTCKHICR